MRRIHPPLGPTAASCFDCMDSMEPVFAQVVERAQEAGWQRATVLDALRLLAGRELTPPCMPGGGPDAMSRSCIAVLAVGLDRP